MGFSRQKYLSGLPFPSPVDHKLSELSTMTDPSWVALHGMAHSFIEWDKAVISLVIVLWLRFSFCLPSDGEVLYSEQKQDQEVTVAQIMNLLQNSKQNWRK